MTEKKTSCFAGSGERPPVRERKGRGRFSSAKGTSGKQAAGNYCSQLQDKVRLPGLVVEREIMEKEGSGAQ